MDSVSARFANGGDTLAAAFRKIRRERGLRTAEVAQRMGMALRSYENFEAGRSRLDIARICEFAEATDSDPFAILFSVPFRSSEFAVACADTKLVYIMMMLLETFFEEHGRDIALLEPPNLIGGFERLFKDLGAKLRENETTLSRFFEGRQGNSISLGNLSVRGLRKKRA